MSEPQSGGGVCGVCVVLRVGALDIPWNTVGISVGKYAGNE